MSQKPNILLLITDQQRFDTIQKNHLCQTPHIEGLMQSGVNFTRAYTPNAICSPARASLMTGVYPSRHGMIDCTHNVQPYRAEFNAQLPLWSQRLKEEGYHGGYFGKWHVERTDELSNFGYEEYIPEHSQDYATYRQELGFGDRTYVDQFMLTHKGYKDRLLYGIYDEPAVSTEPYFLYSQGMEFIKKQAGLQHPWFTVISTLEPHDPFAAPKEYFDRYDLESISIPESFNDDLMNKPGIYQRLRSVWKDMTEQDVRKVAACYYGLCTLIDDQVGRVIELLKKTGQLENTIILYTSDHGELLGAHGLYFKGVPACEEVYHIPLVISGYGVNDPGRKCNAFVSLVDVAPTLSELAGAKAMTDIDGKTLGPLLRNDVSNLDQFPWNEAYAEFHGQRLAYTQRIVWNDRYKYVFNGFDLDELYDLENDPCEMNNLAQDINYQEVLEAMAKRMWNRVYQLGDYSLGNSDYGMFRFAPVGPDHEDNPYTLKGPSSR
jgi:choline-sulfatase